MTMYHRHVWRTQYRYQRGSSEFITEADAEDGTLIQTGLHSVTQTITFITDRQARFFKDNIHWVSLTACHMCHRLAPRANAACGGYRSVMCQASELRYKTGRTYGITYLHWPSTMCCCYIVNTLSSLVGVKPTELVNVLPRAVATTKQRGPRLWYLVPVYSAGVPC